MESPLEEKWVGVSDFKERESICLALHRQIKRAHSLGSCCFTFAVRKLTSA